MLMNNRSIINSIIMKPNFTLTQADAEIRILSHFKCELLRRLTLLETTIFYVVFLLLFFLSLDFQESHTSIVPY